MADSNDDFVQELLQQTFTNCVVFDNPVQCANTVVRIMSRDGVLCHQNMRGYTGIQNVAFDIIRSCHVKAIQPVLYHYPVRCAFSVV